MQTYFFLCSIFFLSFFIPFLYFFDPHYAQMLITFYSIISLFLHFFISISIFLFTFLFTFLSLYYPVRAFLSFCYSVILIFIYFMLCLFISLISIYFIFFTPLALIFGFYFLWAVIWYLRSRSAWKLWLWNLLFNLIFRVQVRQVRICL